MKTAVSIPERLFRQADRLARRLGVTRSRLYAAAIEHYLARRLGENTTERLNAVYGPDGSGSEIDPSLAAAQARTIMEPGDHEAW